MIRFYLRGKKGLEEMNGLHFHTGFLLQFHRLQAVKTAGKKNKCFHCCFHPFRVPLAYILIHYYKIFIIKN